MNFQCKFCKKRVVDFYKCEGCESTFHKSCGIQAKVINSQGKVVCCDQLYPVNVEELPHQNMSVIKINGEDIQKIFKQEFDKFLDQYNKQIEDLKTSIQYMSNKFEDQKALCEEMTDLNKKLLKQNENLHSRVNDLECRLNDIEQKEKAKNIVVSGIPEQENKTVKEVVNKLITGMGLQLHESDILDCYRIKTEKNMKPIVVKFKDDVTKQKVIKQRRQIKSISTRACRFDGADHTIYINDELTKANQILFTKVREYKRTNHYKHAYYVNGKIYLKKTEDSRPIRIISEKNLEDL